MNQSEFNRLKYLSEKAFDGVATLDDLKEFKELVIDFSESKDFNPRSNVDSSLYFP